MNIRNVYLSGNDIHWSLNVGSGFAFYDGDTLIRDYTRSVDDIPHSINDHYYMNWIL